MWLSYMPFAVQRRHTRWTNLGDTQGVAADASVVWDFSSTFSLETEGVKFVASSYLHVGNHRRSLADSSIVSEFHNTASARNIGSRSASGPELAVRESDCFGARTGSVRE